MCAVKVVDMPKLKKDPSQDDGSNLGHFVKRKCVNVLYSISSRKVFNSISPVHDYFLIAGKSSEKMSAKEKIVFFKEFVQYLMFFSYRKKFPKLPDEGGTTDIGWGCILRTAQMLLAVALLRHATISGELSTQCCTEWNARNNPAKHSCICSYHLIQSLFLDDYSAPFSLHRLSAETHRTGVPYGSYITPTAAATALVAISNGLSFSFSIRQGFQINKISEVRMTQLEEHLKMGHSELLLFPIVLGYKTVPEMYLRALFAILKWDCCCGLILGVGASAYFAFGYQKKNFLCLNPHVVQRANLPDCTQYNRKGKCFTIPAEKIEPSALIGLYIHDEKALKVFRRDLDRLNETLPLPLITIRV